MLEFVEPSPSGLVVQLWLSPSIVRKLVNREFNNLLIESLSFSTDGAKPIKCDFTLLVCFSLVRWMTLRSYMRENSKQIMTLV